MYILHVIDPATPEEALEMLAGLMRRSTLTAQHRVLVLGHRAVARAAIRAGLPENCFLFGRSLGWADPVGWRALGKIIKKIQPTHIHAWGVRGAVAATVCAGFKGGRILTLADTPSMRMRQLLRIVTYRATWAVTAGSSSIYRALAAGGLGGTPQRLVRIRPGMALAKAAGVPKLIFRAQLGLEADDGPVLLLGGPATRAARRDHGLWAAAILQQIFPKTRVLVRSGRKAGGETDHGAGDLVRRFAQTLPRDRMTLFVPPEVPWYTLVQAADLLLVTADEPIPTGSILWAMAAGVPVIGTAIECVSELVEHRETGLLAAAGKPRAIAARLEEFMNDATLRWPLTDKARAEVFAHFKEGYMAECFAAVYRQTLEDPELKNGIALPLPELTAQDRFAGVVTTS